MSVEGKPCIRCGSTERYKSGKCKPCSRSKLAEWRCLNKEKAHAATKAWKENNKERVRARDRAWYRANRESVKAKNAIWRASNRDKVNAIIKRWKEANQDKVKAGIAEWSAANPGRKNGYCLNYRRNKKAKSAQAEQRALMMQLGTMLGD